MLYIFDEFDRLDAGFASRAGSLLSEARREKVRKLKTPSIKNQSTIAYLLLRYGLGNEFGINETVDFMYDDNGKPSLSKYPHIHFNLSHCKSAAACAVSLRNVAVDIQHIMGIRDNLARRVLTAEEYSEFLKSADPDEYFCKMWTIKEAYLKMTGQGIGTGLGNISAESIAGNKTYRGRGYFCCVTDKDMEIVKVPYDDLFHCLQRKWFEGSLLNH